MIFGLGLPEILLVLVVALIVFGPKKLPEVSRSLGRGLGELRRSLDEFKFDTSNLQDELRSEKINLESTCEAEIDESAKDTVEELEAPKPESVKTEV
ncbi:UNVERIFIED_CONTAM: hypothetical protein GTU68_023484 [Idotea baltica]|nr:hypothetical protein [Idotea baltica]